jgi:hypothetical protein
MKLEHSSGQECESSLEIRGEGNHKGCPYENRVPLV